MQRYYSTYLDLIGMGNAPSLSTVKDVLKMAIDDGVSELFVNKMEYEMIKDFMIYSAIWNWDRQTFMGIKLIIEK